MSEQFKKDPRLLFGGLLIVLGILFLFGQLFNFHLGDYIWPFYIIVPGGILFFLALREQGAASEGLMVAGSIVSMVGLLLFYQNLTNHWESWAYTWALVGPTSVGLGQMLYGHLKDRDDLYERGRHLATIGGTIFLIGAIFFELIIGISGFGLGRWVWGVLLIGIGILMLLRNLVPSRKA